jgi:hypothetical protein
MTETSTPPVNPIPPVKKEYRVMIVQAGPDESTILGLVPVYSLSSEEPHSTLDPARVLAGPGIQSEDAKMVQDMMKAVFTELDKRMQHMAPPSTQCPGPGVIPLSLSKREYVQLGKPTAHDIITLTLEMEKTEGEPHV